MRPGTAAEGDTARPVPDDELAAAIATYRERGFAVLPGVVPEGTLEALRERAADIMAGRVDPTPFFFQGDAPSGRYEDAPLGEGRWAGPSTYRKIEKLERDPRFFDYLRNDLFARIARVVLGERGVTLYRAILMTKPAAATTPGGTDLPWHQDGGQLWGLARSPELQLWTALDDAPLAAGCMRIALGTHHRGLASPLGGAVPSEVAASTTLDVVEVPAKAGDLVLLHNLVWHASGLNHTASIRRAFSACLLSADNHCTRRRKTPRTFVRLFD